MPFIKDKSMNCYGYHIAEEDIVLVQTSTCFNDVFHVVIFVRLLDFLNKNLSFLCSPWFLVSFSF